MLSVWQLFTIGKIAEPLEITLKICDNITERSAHFICIDLSNGVAAPIEDRSLCFC